MAPERTLKDLSSAEKWDILQLYLKNELSIAQIEKAYSLSERTVHQFIRILWQKMRNIKEAKLLASTKFGDWNLQKVMKEAYIDTEEINTTFLSKLSKEDELLSDSELLFCEFFLEYGDEVKAIISAKLDIGLDKAQKSSYKDACKLRAVYLKKKPNVRSYIYEMRKRNLEVLNEDGKSYIQSSLISLIEQLSKNTSTQTLSSRLKAIEHLGRSIGAFEDKVTVETVNGDEVLDRLIARAKEAQLERKEPIQLENGTEVYE